MVSTQSSSTSQPDGSDSDSTVLSFSVTTPISYLGDSELMLDTEVNYHVYPNRDWLSNFEKLDGYSVVMGDDRQCNMEGICIILINMFDGVVRELKEVRYTLVEEKFYLYWCLESIRS